ncbi:MAG TPA: class I SAM-dependent methyltransferase [Paenibacillaceae bacterium]
MIVTTTERPDRETAALARRLADELGASYVPRSRRTLRELLRRHGADRVLVAGAGGLRLVSDLGPPLFFHPGMALLRIKRLQGGGRDTLVDVTGVRSGDRVLDCTAGLGADAIVFSYAAGPEGKVTALEISPILHVIVREGLASYTTGDAEIDAAMRRIDARRADCAEFLAALPDKSFDIVYFDPMFRIPVRTSPGMVPVRPFAEDRPLDGETVRQAVRVARRRVVLKDHRDSGEFERLGFSALRRPSSAVAYGVIECDGE